MSRTRLSSTVCMLALLIWPMSAAPGPAVAAPVQVGGPATGPVVGGIELATTMVAGWPVYADPDVPPAALIEASVAFAAALDAVPLATGLPPFQTPLAVFLLADQDRFRAALQEIGSVRIDLIAPEVGGYTIEREGTMLIFFPYQVIQVRASATRGFAHELAHLAVREASARRPVPQWLNEGYAEWVSYRVLDEVDPVEADELRGLVPAVVASALHSRVGLLPWSGLVTRARFSRSGTEGWVNLAYGQGTLFVDWLARRYGDGALGIFLQRIGGGAGATEAFTATFGPFGPEDAAFRDSLPSVASEVPPGLRRLTALVRPGRPVLYALIGGQPDEPVVVETLENGEPVQRYELVLDAAGFGLAGIGSETASRPGFKLLRLTSPSFGVLEAGLRADGTFEDEPPHPVPGQAPVQVPGARQRLAPRFAA